MILATRTWQITIILISYRVNIAFLRQWLHNFLSVQCHQISREGKKLVQQELSMQLMKEIRIIKRNFQLWSKDLKSSWLMNWRTEMKKNRLEFKKTCKICLSIMKLVKNKKMMHRLLAGKPRFKRLRTKRKDPPKLHKL